MRFLSTSKPRACSLALKLGRSWVSYRAVLVSGKRMAILPPAAAGAAVSVACATGAVVSVGAAAAVVLVGAAGAAVSVAAGGTGVLVAVSVPQAASNIETTMSKDRIDINRFI